MCDDIYTIEKVKNKGIDFIPITGFVCEFNPAIILKTFLSFIAVLLIQSLVQLVILLFPCSIIASYPIGSPVMLLAAQASIYYWSSLSLNLSTLSKSNTQYNADCDKLKHFLKNRL